MKKFKERYDEYVQSVSGLSNLAEESFLYWFKTYVNQRDPFDPGKFLPGKVYSFEYLDKLDEKKKFVNKRPVVFFTEFDNYQRKQVFKGIDLILMPPQVRIGFFVRIQSIYSGPIESNLKKVENGDISSQSPLQTDYKTLDTVITGINWKNAYRAWDVSKVGDVQEISFEDWTKIVNLHTRSIEGTPIEEIYKKNSQ